MDALSTELVQRVNALSFADTRIIAKKIHVNVPSDARAADAPGIKAEIVEKMSSANELTAVREFFSQRDKEREESHITDDDVKALKGRYFKECQPGGNRSSTAVYVVTKTKPRTVVLSRLVNEDCTTEADKKLQYHSMRIKVPVEVDAFTNKQARVRKHGNEIFLILEKGPHAYEIHNPEQCSWTVIGD